MRTILLPFAIALSAAAAKPARLPECISTTEDGFKHPGIYHDCVSLDRIQTNYQSGKSAYVEALASSIDRLPALQPNSTWEMEGPFESVVWAGEDGHNIPLQNDGKSSYALTLGWYATGNEEWLSRAKTTILAWGETLKYLNEHIQGGEGLAYMTAAAEILRAASACSGWSESDTKTYLDMIGRIIVPWNQTEGLTRYDFFMNQGFYGNGGAMNAAVFSNNRSMYDEMIKHATVGSNPDPTLDYAIPIQISGDPDYYGQVTEMGRDQSHPMGTLRGLSFMGTTSRIQNGADFYIQDSARLLAGFEYWSRYNGGDNTTPWERKEIRVGSGEFYDRLSETSRGRNYAQYEQPLEAIGVAYHEYYRRGFVDDMPFYANYMEWQGIGWDTFEWGDDDTIGYIGLS